MVSFSQRDPNVLRHDLNECLIYQSSFAVSPYSDKFACDSFVSGKLAEHSKNLFSLFQCSNIAEGFLRVISRLDVVSSVIPKS